METCIYLKESQTPLTYNSREHVIPAGLGGIAKLPKGTVSDEANSIFSRREIVALRETILAINRRNNGPGKRGSESVYSIKNPHITVLEDASNSESSVNGQVLFPVKLGYLFSGEVYIIPQIYCEINLDNSVRIPILSLGTLVEEPENEYVDFSVELERFLAQTGKTQSSFILVKTELKIKQKYISIGCYRKKWYICTSLSELDLSRYLRLLEMRPIPREMIIIQEEAKEYNFSEKMPDAFGDAFTFIYAKTALNTLAYLKSSNFVRDAQFDDIRSSIVSGEDIDRFIIKQHSPKWFSNWVIEHVPEKSHFVVLHGHEGCIDAYVGFYRENVTNPIRLSKAYAGEEFRLFFFCNYLVKDEKRGSINL